MCQIAKRDGRIVPFDAEKIQNAVLKAFKEVDHTPTVEDASIAIVIAEEIEKLSLEKKEKNEIFSVEEIQDLVEDKLMNSTRQDVAKAYIRYRYKRNMARTNTLDQDIKELIEGTNEYWNYENSNKNAQEVTVLRDYLAGISCTDAARRYMLPEDVVEAHDNGYIHFHDMDYSPVMPIHNCCLLNLNDMLQNGTVINEVLIEKPHRFKTAANIATQIILGVSSSQYGGTTITTAHLAPFVRDSYNRYLKEVKEELEKAGLTFNEEQITKIAKDRLKKEINEGVQIINYQLNSMHNTNGLVFLAVKKSREPLLNGCVP